MAEPKKKLSKTRTGWRRGRQQKVAPALVTCAKCKQQIPPHQACPFCGYYRGQQVIEIKEKKK